MPLHPYLQNPGPLVLAHRGFSAAHPENTVAAFGAAVELGCRYVETDVHTTADGVLVAFHDDRLDRVTDRSGLIRDLPWSEVARARVAGVEPIPRFEEILAAWPRVQVNVDVKAPGAVGPLALAIERARAHDRVCVGSFSERRRAGVLRRLTRPACSSAGTERLAALLGALRAGLPAAPLLRGVDCLQVPLRHRGIPVFTPSLVAAAHGAGVQVHVWTIDHESVMRKVLAAGADGVVTNRPDVALRMLRQDRVGRLITRYLSPTLRLRPFDPDAATPEELAELLTWYQDPVTIRLVDGPDAQVHDQDVLMRMYRHLRDTAELYLVEETRDGGPWLPVGDVALSEDAVPIVLAPSARGRGIGRAVLGAMIDRSRELGRTTVEVSDIYHYNAASRALFEGLGFTRGEATKHGNRWSLTL